jgi:outer membrane protease
MYGEGEEIVYGAPSGAPYLSQLRWDIKPLMYFGAGLSLVVKNPALPVGFFTGLLVKAGIPGFTGSMEDRDWLDDDQQYLTNFSTHTNYTAGAFFLDYDLGLSIPIRLTETRTMDLKIFGRLSWMDLEWTSYNGYLQYGAHSNDSPDYGPWDASLPKTFSYGPAVGYNQVWILAAPGIGADIPVGDLFRIGVSVTITPFIWAYAHDSHFKRNMQFKEYPSGGLMLEPWGELVFSPNERLAIALYVSYRYIADAQGNSYYRNNTGDFIPGGIAGAGYHALDAGLSLKVRL